MEYQYELLDAYRYDGKNSYDFVNNISIEVDFDNPLTNSELEFFMQTIRKDIILAQHKNRTHGLICAESLSDYERAGDIDALEGITLDDYTKNTTKIINLKNINGIVSYIAALILIKSRRDHVDSKNTKNKLENDIFEVAEKLRDFVGNPNNFHPLGGFKEKNERHHDNKKISNDGLGDSTIKAKRADVLKATEEVCKLIRQGYDAYIPTAKLREK
jgi:hypothetical protein